MSLLDKIAGKEEELEVQEAPVVEAPATEKIEEIRIPAAKSDDAAGTYLDEMGVIAEGTTVHGDIKAKGHLAVVGVVEGDVQIAGNLMLQGIIKGSIECNNLVINNSGKLNAIRARGSVSVKEGCTVEGSISCKHISVLGNVVGDINASGNVGLSKSCSVRGNITSAVLAVEPGAKIQGMVSVK